MGVSIVSLENGDIGVAFETGRKGVSLETGVSRVALEIGIEGTSGGVEGSRVSLPVFSVHPIARNTLDKIMRVTISFLIHSPLCEDQMFIINDSIL
jgi:predicted metal-dependent RNase